MINDAPANWRAWNEDGFLPGPNETEEEFYQRIAFCQNLEKNLTDKTGVELPFEPGTSAPKEILAEAFAITKALFGIAPLWVPVFFSNYQLAPWHGGCAWIFQIDQDTPMAAFLQLRASFKHHLTYLGLYNRRDLMAHELAHVGRMLYHEPKFEEIIAYQTCSSKWRRYLGPIVQSSFESLLFLLILGAVVLAIFSLSTMGSPLSDSIAEWLIAIPLALITYGLARLSQRHTIFNRCLKQLTTLYGNSQMAQQVIYRLTDEEIILFSNSSTGEIRQEMEKRSTNSFRWRFLHHNYPPN